MQYRWRVSDCSCHEGAVRSSATLMTWPHAAFTQAGIVRLRIRSWVSLLSGASYNIYVCMRAVEQLRCNTAGL